MAESIKTYTNESFRHQYIRAEALVDNLLKTNFGHFFVTRIEDAIPTMKLPVPPVRSTNHSLVYLSQGEVTMGVGAETYRIGPDTCLFVPAGQVFSVDAVNMVNENEGYLCNFHPDFLIGRFGKAELLNDYEFLRVWGNPHVRLDKPTADFVSQVFNRMLLHYSTFGLTQLVLIQATFITLLSEINQAYQPALVSPKIPALNITNRFKELLFTYGKNYHLVAEYADRLNISANHLNKSVRLITGKSPIKWIDETIVLEAKVLLYQTQLSIGEVAAQVGIADASYFSHLFKKYATVTPSAFRKMIEIHQ
ncbi:helix-turn-helix transcriptional regulator [Spirosoma sp. KCTC 42546]|uniref:helix-turn-helix domain-containing protein n=1 Tax=Spirosoma sp. KCTC 42546 TaxID=2520506 RepID=UPI001157EA43|nr:helix-turn-helix transcriptional regulator [Spirosoma sp. KCTC 42546]QDK82364.1 helix-turn-helix transcriptional regulator [Spirosoma sp. KCTC 42546]